MKQGKSVRIARTIVCLVAVAVLAVPLGVAQEPTAEKAEPHKPLDVSLLSPREDKEGFDGVLAVRIGELFVDPKLAKTAERINEWLNKGLKESAGFCLPIQVQDIDQLTFRLSVQFKDGPKTNLLFLGGLSSIRMTKPTDWVKIIKAIPDARITTQDGKTRFAFSFEILKLFPEEIRKMVGSQWRDRLDGKRFAVGGRIVDDRTVLMGEPDSPKDKAQARLGWAPEWQEVDDGLLAFVLHNAKRPEADKAAETPPKKDDEEQGKLSQPELLWLPWVRGLVGIDTRERVRVKAWVVCHTASEAEEMAKACSALLKEMRKAEADKPADQKSGDLFWETFWRNLFDSTVIKRVGEKVMITAETDKP